ncbi:MAG: glycine cleavage system aminomethyltransferase GcvT [Candidatus Eisenbacteria bacterium]|nr:glycine cleavage system aminomethyltransferase GcvT [Candidatus Eisenbacteria bacterium]
MLRRAPGPSARHGGRGDVGEKTKTARRTPLHEAHVELDARLVEFAGFLMPMTYDGIVAEHRRVRESVGLFDVSHMGEIHIRGDGALDFVERITTNRASALDVGGVQYSAMCYQDGGFIDDLLVYRLSDSYMLVVNAANHAKDLEWIRSHAAGDVEIDDASDRTALIAVQGPNAGPVADRVAEDDLGEVGYYRSTETNVLGSGAVVSRTGYTGEDGFEIYCGTDRAPEVWSALMEAGHEYGVGPAGLGARDTLRLEMGYALYGNDIDETRTPVEANLMWITRLKKGDFIGRDAIAARRERGPVARLVGFEAEGRRIPRHGHGIIVGGETVGEVTSGTFSPSLERAIGMGYVPDGTNGGIEIDVRGTAVPATIVPLPFYRDGTVRSKR